MNRKTTRRKIRWGVSLSLLFAGALTLIPYPNVLHSSILGYHSLCSFSPMSTALLWGMAGFIAWQPRRIRRRRLSRNALYGLAILTFLYGSLHSSYLGFIGALSWQSTSFPALHPEKIADGTYVGKSRNIGKKVILKVAVQKGKLTKIETLSQGYASSFGKKAFEYLPDRILQAQSLDVDAVTGATHSSHQIKAAVQNAMEEASSKPRSKAR